MATIDRPVIIPYIISTFTATGFASDEDTIRSSHGVMLTLTVVEIVMMLAILTEGPNQFPIVEPLTIEAIVSVRTRWP